MNQSNLCRCASLDDLVAVAIGALDRSDDRIFSSLTRLQSHGGEQWWLYASRCNVCSQHWMIAQDERIHDNFYLKRLSQAEFAEAVGKGTWPSDFLTYEQVLRLGRQFGMVCRFVDPKSPALTQTVEDLRRNRPDISRSEIAYLLAISDEAAAALLAD